MEEPIVPGTGPEGEPVSPEPAVSTTPQTISSALGPPSTGDASSVPSPFGLPPAPPPRPKPKFILGGLAIALGLFVAYLRAWGWSYGMMGAQAWGYAWGATLLPALIAYAIAGRKRVRNFNRFGLWFSGISLLFFVMSASTGKTLTLQQHIGNLMKEAAGTKPVDNSGPGELDSIVRAMMQDILAMRKSLDEETAPLNADLGKIYGAETFRDRASMQKSIDSVHAVVKADQRFGDQLQHLPDRMQTIVDKSTLSSLDKEQFMEGVRKGFSGLKALAIRQQALETEKKWESETVGLYEFAMAHAERIHVKGSHITIYGAPTLNEFNDRMQKAQNQRDDMNKLNEQLDQAQQASLQEAGVTKKDLGLDDKK